MTKKICGTGMCYEKKVIRRSISFQGQNVSKVSKSNKFK